VGNLQEPLQEDPRTQDLFPLIQSQGPRGALLVLEIFPIIPLETDLGSCRPPELNASATGLA